jgi:hypothetical protein
VEGKHAFPGDVARSYFVGVFIPKEKAESCVHGEGAALPWIEEVVLSYHDPFHPHVSGE